jgi:FAD/FMN-containing dehydrogenase
VRKRSKSAMDVGEAIAHVIGTENVSHSRSAIAKHSFDALRRNRGFDVPAQGFPPDLVVTPSSVDEVIAIVKLANRYRVPLVPWGAGTGLMGGAEAVNGGVCVDFGRKMHRVVSFDSESRTIEVEAGATLGEVDRYLRRRSFFLAHDPWTRDFATVGGAISTNGVGYLGSKYGRMGDQVTAMEVVLPTGELLKTNPQPAKSGFDFNRLFIGTEGTFGLITRARIKSYPLPEEEVHVAYRFDDFPLAFRAAIVLDALELPGLDVLGDGESPECRLYLTLFGGRREVKLLEQRCSQRVSAAGGRRLDESEALSYWRDRHKVAQEYVRKVSESPYSYWKGEKAFDYLHVAVPLSMVLRFWKKVRGIVGELELDIDDYGVFCRPGLFSVTLERKDGVPQDNLQLGVDRIVEEAVKLGGYFEYVHGIGIRYRRMMEMQNGVGKEILRKLKDTLDPQGILNPGKAGL